MKIILINPVFTGYGGLEGVGGNAPPLNLGYLAAYGGAIALAGGITTYVGVGCWCDGIRSVAGVVPFLNHLAEAELAELELATDEALGRMEPEGSAP